MSTTDIVTTRDAHAVWRQRLTVVPVVLWVGLTVLHPYTFEEVLDGHRHDTWLGVHVAQLALTPLLALSVLHLIAGLPGRSALVARVAAVCWAGLFAGFDAIAGVATGVLVRLGQEDAAEALFLHGGVGGDVTILSVIAHPLWGLTAIAAARALGHHAGARATRLGLYLSLPFALTHVGPVATASLAALAIGMLIGADRGPHLASHRVHAGSVSTGAI